MGQHVVSTFAAPLKTSDSLKSPPAATLLGPEILPKTTQKMFFSVRHRINAWYYFYGKCIGKYAIH